MALRQKRTSMSIAIVVVVVITYVASLGRRVAPPWPVSRDWQEQIQCRCGVGLSRTTSPVPAK